MGRRPTRLRPRPIRRPPRRRTATPSPCSGGPGTSGMPGRGAVTRPSRRPRAAAGATVIGMNNRWRPRVR